MSFPLVANTVPVGMEAPPLRGLYPKGWAVGRVAKASHYHAFPHGLVAFNCCSRAGWPDACSFLHPGVRMAEKEGISANHSARAMVMAL